MERIKRNSKDWGLNEGKELGNKLKYDSVKSFMNTDVVQKLALNMDLTLT